MAGPYYVFSTDVNSFTPRYEDGGMAARRSELEAGWKRFNRLDPATGRTLPILYRPSNRHSEVQVDYWMPRQAALDRYRIEIFVPGRHATTRQAIFTIAHTVNGEGDAVEYEDTVSSVDMYNCYDVWVSLGEYILDPASHPLSGRVRQFDLSLEDPPTEIAFSAARWISLTSPVEKAPEEDVVTPLPGQGERRFDSPVGSLEERNNPLAEGIIASGFGPVWHGLWYDATPYLTWYMYGYHTGADLNIRGVSSADKDAPIYASGDGMVTYAGKAGSWGNIVVIEHPEALVTLPDGSTHRQKVYTRYGHVTDNILVSTGNAVRRGQNIAFIGLAEGATSGWHLHFDVSHSKMLASRPAHWPNLDRVRELQKAKVSTSSRDFIDAQIQVKKEVMAHYLDPYQFIRLNRNG